jgi:transposase
MHTIKQTHSEAIKRASEIITTIPFSKVTMKLQAIAAVSNCTISKVSEVFNVTNQTIKFWIRSFEKYGIAGLETKAKNPRKPKLTDAQKEQIKRAIENDPNLTMKALKLMVLKEFKVEMSLVGIWKNVKKMNFSHITPRPLHYKQDKQKLEEFKKNSQPKSLSKKVKR